MTNETGALSLSLLVRALRHNGLFPEWEKLVIIASQNASEEQFRELADLLGSEDREVRQSVAAVMAKISNPYAVRLLVEKALEDQDEQIVKVAISALIQTRESAVQLLQEVMENSDGLVHIRAAVILAEIGNAVGIDILLRAIDSEDKLDIVEELLPKILEVLGKFGDTRAIAPLIGFLMKDYWLLRLVAAKSLVMMGESAVESLLDVTKNSRDLDARCRAVEALGQIGSSSAVFPLVELLGTTETPLQNEIINTLGRIGEATSLEALIQILSGEDASMYFKVGKSLVKIGQPAVPDLVHLLKEHPSPDARRCVTAALGQIGDTEAVPTIIDALRDRDSLVRKAATDALGQLKDRRAVTALCGMLEGENWFVVQGAADALAKIGDTQAITPLLKTLEDDRSEIRQHIVKALLRFVQTLNDWLVESEEKGTPSAFGPDGSGYPSDQEIVDLLVSILRDNDLDVRANAAKLLVRLKGELLKNRIDVILQHDDQGAREIREALLELNKGHYDDMAFI